MHRFLAAIIRAHAALRSLPPLTRTLNRAMHRLAHASPTTHLVLSLLTAAIVVAWSTRLWQGVVVVSADLLRFVPDSSSFMRWSLVAAAVLVALLILVLTSFALLLVVQQKAQHWQRTNPQRFDAARNLWTSLVLAHHHVVVEPYTDMRIAQGALHIAGTHTPTTPRQARKVIMEVTTRTLQMDRRERLHFSLSLWFESRVLVNHFVYTPPSAHEQLRTRTILLDAQRQRTKLVLTPISSLTLG